MSTASTIDIKGTTGEKVTLPKGVFGIEAPTALVAQAVRVYRSNQRKANAKTKTRAEVSKTTAKMYRQKGTGRARHGSYAAPIFVGGGIAFGPDGLQNHKMSMPKTMGRLALLSALSQKAEDKVVSVLTGLDKAKKTKDVKALSGRKLVIIGDKQDGMTLRNLEGVEVARVSQLNTFQAAMAKAIVITSEALEELVKKYAN